MGRFYPKAFSLALLAVLPWVAAAPAKAGSYEVLYTFGSNAGDGGIPWGTLTPFLGNLYGTTTAGGSGSNGINSCGTVFKITPQGVETVLHSFLCNGDTIPRAGLNFFNGKFYGSTSWGSVPLHGKASGSIFSIDPQGNFTTLHRFGPDGNIGSGPYWELTRVGPFFHGIFLDVRGSVFRIAYDGSKFAVLHRFSVSEHISPYGPLLNIGGTLYGASPGGGSGCSFSDLDGCGLVYKISLQGAVSTVYEFKGPKSDGAFPEYAFATIGSTIYGETAAGGFDNSGIIYSLSTAGSEKVIHTFKPAAGLNSLDISGGLISVGGALYGVTQGGGTYDNGTVFKIDLDGVEHVLYSFNGFQDGCATPVGGLAYLGGYLYGTTTYGGPKQGGCVFRVGLFP